MSRNLLPILFGCLVLIFSVSPGSGQTHEFKDKNQTLEIDFPLGHVPQYGFQLVRLTASNSGNRKAVWDISMTEERYSGRDSKPSHAQHDSLLEVAPGATAQRDILLALGSTELDTYGGSQKNLKVEVVMPSGKRETWHDYSSYDGHSHSSHMRSNAPMLIGDGVNTAMPHRFRSDICKSMKTSTAPTDWRAYTPFRIVMLTNSDWISMKSDARAALSEWIRMGGILQYIDEIPSDGIKPDVSGFRAYGLGEVHGPMPTDKRENIDSYPAVKELERESVVGLLGTATEKNMLRTWLKNMDSGLLLEKFTIWPVILVLITFFVMITPINLFVLAPSRRRHRLVKTIPVISIIACIALAVAVFVADGTGGEGKRIVLIEVQHGTDNRQYINQWQASQCGAIFGNRFQIKDQAYISPINIAGSQATLDVSSDLVDANGGWFSSRSAQSHRLKAVRASRGRIEWSVDSGDSPTIVSTFNFPLTDILIKDKQDSWWHASSVKQGQAVTLKPIKLGMANDKINASIENIPLESDVRNLAHRSGHFIAFTDSPPAIETLNSIDWTDTGVITGPLVEK